MNLRKLLCIFGHKWKWLYKVNRKDRHGAGVIRCKRCGKRREWHRLIDGGFEIEEPVS